MRTKIEADSKFIFLFISLCIYMHNTVVHSKPATRVFLQPSPEDQAIYGYDFLTFMSIVLISYEPCKDKMAVLILPEVF